MKKEANVINLFIAFIELKEERKKQQHISHFFFWHFSKKNHLTKNKINLFSRKKKKKYAKNLPFKKKKME